MSRGVSNTHHSDDNQSSPATPSNSWKKLYTAIRNNTTNKNNKNPYSSRGLEKFTSVLSELEAKKEKIFTRIGTDVAMVRFKYSTSQDFIPIVFKIREEGSKKNSPVSPKLKPEPVPKEERPAPNSPSPRLPEPVPKEQSAPNSPAPPVPKEQTAPNSPAPRLPEAEKKVKKSVRWSGEGKKGGELWRWRPSYYMMVLVLLVLACLVVFGRVFAVCCTAVWWYLVPLLKDQGSHENGMRRWYSKKKKDCGRKFGDEKLSAIAGSGSSSFKKVGSGGSVVV